MSGEKIADAVGDEKPLAFDLVPLAERNRFDFSLLSEQVEVRAAEPEKGRRCVMIYKLGIYSGLSVMGYWFR